MKYYKIENALKILLNKPRLNPEIDRAIYQALYILKRDFGIIATTHFLKQFIQAKDKNLKNLKVYNLLKRLKLTTHKEIKPYAKLTQKPFKIDIPQYAVKTYGLKPTWELKNAVYNKKVLREFVQKGNISYKAINL